MISTAPVQISPPPFIPENRLQNILDTYPEECFIKADGYDSAIVGVVIAGPAEANRLLYSRSEILDILMARDGMDITEAEEFFDFNIVGAHIDGGPLYLDDECADQFTASELGLTIIDGLCDCEPPCDSCDCRD